MKKILRPIPIVYKIVAIAFLLLFFIFPSTAQSIAAGYTNNMLSAFNTNAHTSLSVYPNPAADEAKLVFNASKYGVPYQVRIVNNAGIQLTNVEGTTVEGQNIIRIHVGNYPPGFYYINLLTSAGTETLKLLKQPLTNL